MRQAGNTSRKGVEQRRRAKASSKDATRRRRATSLCDDSAGRRCVTSSNTLPFCKLQLSSGMPALDKATLHTWLHHWQDEYDAAYLYLVLAGQERDQKRKDVYIKMAGVEERSVKLWDRLLAEHGPHTLGG